MHVSRFLIAAGMALAVAVTMSVTSLAQSNTDEDYDKLMKAVGAANGAMRGSANEQNIAGTSAEAAKLVALFKDVQAFWTARNNAEAAEWAGAAMKHADALAKSTDMGAAMGALKELGGTCQTCHAKYRDKDANGFIIKKESSTLAQAERPAIEKVVQQWAAVLGTRDVAKISTVRSLTPAEITSWNNMNKAYSAVQVRVTLTADPEIKDDQAVVPVEENMVVTQKNGIRITREPKRLNYRMQKVSGEWRLLPP